MEMIVVELTNVFRKVDKNYIESKEGVESNTVMKYFLPIIQGEYWMNIALVLPKFYSYYFISTYGRVFSLSQNRMLTPINRSGYISINLRGENISGCYILLHRLMMLAFNPIANPDQYEVNHIDGDKTNNRIWNLEWCTRLDNARHAVNNGLYLRGQDAPVSIYTDEQIHKICQELSNGKSYKDIAYLLGIKYSDSFHSTLVQLKSGSIWSHISKQYTYPKELSYQLFSNKMLEHACQIIDSGIIDTITILNKMGVDLKSIDKYKLIAYKRLINELKLGNRALHISCKYNFSKNFSPEIKEKMSKIRC